MVWNGGDSRTQILKRSDCVQSVDTHVEWKFTRQQLEAMKGQPMNNNSRNLDEKTIRIIKCMMNGAIVALKRRREEEKFLTEYKEYDYVRQHHFDEQWRANEVKHVYIRCAKHVSGIYWS